MPLPSQAGVFAYMEFFAMQTEPEVITEHTELINSTNIERIITGRDAALAQIEQVIQQLNAISQLTAGIGGGNTADWAMKQGHPYDWWLMEMPEKAMPVITRNIDRSLWRDLMLKSGMFSLMDAQARTKWYQNLDDGDLPAISEANFLSTFEQLHQSKAEVFERASLMCLKDCHGITKLRARASSARRSSSILW